MNPSKLSRERLYFYSTLNQINTSIEVNTIYTVYITVDDGRTILINEKFKSRVNEITTTQLSKENLGAVCEVPFVFESNRKQY